MEASRTPDTQSLRRTIAAFPTRTQWRAAPVWEATSRAVRACLGSVRRYAPETVTQAAQPDRLHVVHWNILHGGRLDRVREALTGDPALAGADLVALNEVDVGLSRSGGVDVASELARTLGLHGVWAPMFLELEGGHRTGAGVELETGECLFGLALLSRYPIGTVRRVELPTPYDVLFEVERKVGDFVALVVEVLHPTRPFHVVVTHLDVHRNPEDRLRQVETALTALPIGPAILCGDLNTTTLRRGSWGRALVAGVMLATWPQAALDRRLLQPFEPRPRPREPLFTALAAAGFGYAPFHDGAPTLRLHSGDLHEVQRLPASLRRVVAVVLRHIERRARHRLDWIVARGFAGDPQRPPQTAARWMQSPDAASDHAPITCGLVWPPEPGVAASTAGGTP